MIQKLQPWDTALHGNCAPNRGHMVMIWRLLSGSSKVQNRVLTVDAACAYCAALSRMRAAVVSPAAISEACAARISSLILLKLAS